MPRLSAVLSGLLVLVCLSPIIAAAGGPTWPQVGGDAAHTGTNVADSVISQCAVRSFGQRWIADLGRSAQGAPSVVDGQVFAGSEAGTLTVLDANTGAVLRSRNLGSRISTPAVSGNRVFLATGAGSVVAVDRGTLADLWRTDANSNGQQSATVGSGLVLVATEKLRAFDPGSGNVVWTFGGDVGVTYEPAILGNRIAVTNGDLNGLGLQGQELWNASNPSWGFRGMALRVSGTADTAYVGGFNGKFGAFNMTTGQLLWQVQLGGEVFSPAIANGLLYVQDDSNTVTALDAGPGNVVWRYDTAKGQKPPGRSSNFPPTYVNGMLFVSTGHVDLNRASLDNYVIALDAQTGALLWEFSLGRERGTQPTVSDGQVFVQTEARLRAFGAVPPLGSGPGVTPDPTKKYRVYLPMAYGFSC